MSKRYAVACGAGAALGAAALALVSYCEGSIAIWNATGIPTEQGGKTQPLVDKGIAIARCNYLLDHTLQFVCAGIFFGIGVLVAFDCIFKPLCGKLGFDLPFWLYFLGVLIITFPLWGIF
jgi:hypothetical protein